MSKKPATMTHTSAERKAWHNGKQKPGEGSMAWFRRTIGLKNYKGAMSHRKLKRGIFYQPLAD